MPESIKGVSWSTVPPPATSEAICCSIRFKEASEHHVTTRMELSSTSQGRKLDPLA